MPRGRSDMVMGPSEATSASQTPRPKVRPNKWLSSSSSAPGSLSWPTRCQCRGGAEVRALMPELNFVDLTAPIFHWVVPRINSRLRAIMGEQVYKGLIDWDIDLTSLKAEQIVLITSCSSITSLIEMLIAQMKYSIMHSSPSNSALRIDHPVYDLAPKFVKNLAAIAEGLFVNIDFLCFTVQSPVTMQQMVANTSKGLLQVFEAVNDFHQVFNSAVENDVEMLNELRMYHKILQAEDYKASEYLVGPLERHLDIVTRKLYNLDKELRPLRLRA
ncbi:uncharacterized protein LOC119311125 isoform X1 [Triticum dicoccoides]|uniref:uncharacterized protein LOC119311125 isoform X1 n=2 Tax=Triticum dicoccoides TaxID=85692 RepID=UPI001891238B|nr:uncharacterized protein LOC119311125 isoform X1 [Triticum dicoccoides]